jgi:hypothetical protein
MPCTGNQTENCGGSNRLTPFRYYTGLGSTASSTAIVRSISSAALIATGLPRGFEYKGCYVDGPGSCILNFQQPDDQSMTVASCATRCPLLAMRWQVWSTTTNASVTTWFAWAAHVHLQSRNAAQSVQATQRKRAAAPVDLVSGRIGPH